MSWPHWLIINSAAFYSFVKTIIPHRVQANSSFLIVEDEGTVAQGTLKRRETKTFEAAQLFCELQILNVSQ
jgi:hypothetical protein